METSILKTVGEVAGIGGLSLGVFLLVFRQVIAKKVFSALTPIQSYRLLRLIIVFTWSIAVLGMCAWVYASRTAAHQEANVTPARRELQTDGTRIQVYPGENGNVRGSEFRAKARILASPIPAKLQIELYGNQDNWWRIVGVVYAPNSGDLELSVERMPNMYSMGSETRIIVHADGFRSVAADVDLSASETADIALPREGPISLQRVTRLESKDDSVSYDIIIANALTSPAWIKRIGVVGLGTTNRVCNPNPIATFEYQLALSVSEKEAKGVVKQAHDTNGIPVKGSLKHAYCDGYLVLSYPQTIKIGPQDKISYVLSIQELVMSLTSGESPFKDETKTIHRLGLSVLQVKELFKEKPRKVSPKDFLLDREPSYFGPSWSSIQVIAELDSGQLLIGKASQLDYRTDFIKEAKKAIVENGFTDRQAEEILRNAYR